MLRRGGRVRLWMVAILLLLGESTVLAGQLEVVLIGRLGEPGSTAALDLVVRPGSGPQEAERVQTISFPQERVKTFDLPEGTWSVEARGPGIWASSQTVAVEKEGSRRVELELYDAAAVHGKVAGEKGDSLPSELAFELYEPFPVPSTRAISHSSPPARSPQDALAFRCPIRDDTFECPIPAGKSDVRARASGHISHYFWNLPVPKGTKADLGRLLLRRGASVVGWVAADGPVPEGRTIKIVLSPLQAGPTAKAETTQRALTLSTQASERGFFHFEAVPPGAYAVTASLEGFAPAKFYPLRVVEERESQLQAPLVLYPPLQLEVWADPPTDPAHRRWRIEVFDLGETPGTMEKVAEGTAGEDGLWRTTEVAPGRLLLKLLDEEGTPWAFEETEAQGSSVRIQFTLDLLEVDGDVTLGGEPLPATLYFGGKRGVPRFRFESDEEGRFTGLLPREGPWRVEIEATSPLVRRSLSAIDVRRAAGRQTAHVVLELPDGRLRGRVVREDGQSVQKGTVTLSRAGEAPVGVETGDDGSFEMSGVGSGPAYVQARAGGEESEVLWLDIDEKAGEEPLRLVLQRKKEVTGWVLGPTLEGIAGARVLAEAPGQIRDQAVTDFSGKFTLRVPAGSPVLDLVVLPPGYSLQATRLSLSKGEDLRLVVEPQGGTLRLQGLAEPGAAVPSASTVFLSLNGVLVSLPVLRDWAQTNGMSSSGPGDQIYPQVAAGQYQICRVPFREVGAWRKGLRTLGHCATGNLAAGGELALRAPVD